MEELYRKVAEFTGGVSTGAKIGIAVAFTLVTTSIAMAVIVAMPADHFSREASEDSWWHRHALIRWPFLVVKNAVGLVLLVLGIIMIPAPGPGLVVCALALSLLNFPGKRRLVLRLVSSPAVLKSINDIRGLFGKAPLVVELPGSR